MNLLQSVFILNEAAAARAAGFLASQRNLTFSLFGADLDQGGEPDWGVVSHA